MNTGNKTLRFVIPGRPITKKNSQRIVRNKKTGAYVPIPSEQYEAYEEKAKWYLRYHGEPINYRVNVKCLYYMPTRGKVDLTNLLEATDDILVDAKILADDSFKIVYSHDGSRVLYDKENPRVEIEIEEAQE